MRRTLVAGAVTLVATLIMAGVASATPTYFLRVEAPGATLDPGTYYALPDQIAAQRGETPASGTCTRSGGDIPVGGKSALGLAVAAAEASQALQPTLVAEDSFGKRICRMDGFNETDTPFTGWLFRENHVAPTMSAELVPIGENDQTLWVFANFGTNANTGDELVLNGPFRATPGSIQVQVSAVTFDGVTNPAPDGTVITGGSSPVTTTGGVATVPVSASSTLHAIGPGAAPIEIPSNELPVCVAAALADCPPEPGKRIVGTNLHDGLRGGLGPDQIRTRGGKDTVKVRGGSIDKVDCGTGKDVVIADRTDRVKHCEKVRTKGGKKHKKKKKGKGKR